MRARHMLLGISVISLLSAGAATAEQPVTLPVFASGGIAIRGHDPVAYFRDGRPVRGSAAFAHAWQGVIWRFASAANRDAFAAEPDRYAPQYGGFCAFAVANGYSAPIDPAAWRIVAGRLYLNYDRATQRRWESDFPATSPEPTRIGPRSRRDWRRAERRCVSGRSPRRPSGSS